ncbi:MAG: hypothetical protein Q8P50_15030 [Bacillota bacterium]|nr:hypothetical protein [Bacillota bacterium]
MRILSDDVLYPEASDFVRQHCQDRVPKPAQIHGLLQFSQSWGDWQSFVNHQKEREGHPDREFYHALARWNENCRKRAKEEWNLVSSGPTKAETNRQLSLVCGLLVAEFVQHLAAELLRVPRSRSES